ncbi:MAG: transglycosylase SLT domain-containing protein [Oligoflexia bacterium]|nr:transglycosylase SLT domain-containing protein [Oligoflexia bacterium]
MRLSDQKPLDFIKQSCSALILLLYLALGSACAPMQVIDTTIRQQSLTSYNQNLTESKKVIVDEIIKMTYKPFPMDYNSYVKKWLYYYSRGKGREHMKRYLERSNRYLEYMGDILAKNSLPRELVYMSMTESGFWPYAKSPANAVGYWQFIKPTGQSYKLKISPYVDERRDFALSTQAATNYLRDLYSVFQDWRLSIAAYNCGEQCVRNGIRRKNSKNFWYLVSKKALPPETREYVPKVIAMARIALEPASYGFYNLSYQQPLDYRLISIKGDSSLSQIANYLKVPYNEIKSLNPKFKTDRVPAGSGSQLRIPSYITI